MIFLIVAGGIGGSVAVLIVLACRAIAPAANPTRQQYVFRFGVPGPNTVQGIPPNATIEAPTTCPFCKRPAKAVATRESVRVECRDCGVLEGKADVSGTGVYSIPT